MNVIYRDENCELVQEVGDKLVVIRYQGKPILVERENVTAPGDDQPKDNAGAGARPGKTAARKRRSKSNE